MTNRELIDCCKSRKDCMYCPYNYENGSIKCDQFTMVMGYSPCFYTDNDDEFLSREVGKQIVENTNR